MGMLSLVGLSAHQDRTLTPTPAAGFSCLSELNGLTIPDTALLSEKRLKTVKDLIFTMAALASPLAEIERAYRQNWVNFGGFIDSLYRQHLLEQYFGEFVDVSVSPKKERLQTFDGRSIQAAQLHWEVDYLNLIPLLNIHHYLQNLFRLTHVLLKQVEDQSIQLENLNKVLSERIFRMAYNQSIDQLKASDIEAAKSFHTSTTSLPSEIYHPKIPKQTRISLNFINEVTRTLKLHTGNNSAFHRLFFFQMSKLIEAIDLFLLETSANSAAN